MEKNVKQTDYGYEVTWANTTNYCSKILVFEKPNTKLPLHFHKDTTKSWFVNAGKFKVQWVDTKDAQSYARELEEGSVFHVNPLMPVTIESLAENSVLAETSSGSTEEDYYRLG